MKKLWLVILMFICFEKANSQNNIFYVSELSVETTYQSYKGLKMTVLYVWCRNDIWQIVVDETLNVKGDSISFVALRGNEKLTHSGWEDYSFYDACGRLSYEGNCQDCDEPDFHRMPTYQHDACFYNDSPNFDDGKDVKPFDFVRIVTSTGYRDYRILAYNVYTSYIENHAGEYVLYYFPINSQCFDVRFQEYIKLSNFPLIPCDIDGKKQYSDLCNQKTVSISYKNDKTVCLTSKEKYLNYVPMQYFYPKSNDVSFISKEHAPDSIYYKKLCLRLQISDTVYYGYYTTPTPMYRLYNLKDIKSPQLLDSVSFYKKLDFFQDSVLKIEGTYYEKKRSDSIKGTRILLAEMNIDEKGYVVDISIKSGTNIPFSREQEEKFKELFIRQKLFSPGTRLMVPIKTHKVIVYQLK